MRNATNMAGLAAKEMEVSPFSNAMLVYCCMKTRSKSQSRMNFIFIIKVISLLVPLLW